MGRRGSVPCGRFPLAVLWPWLQFPVGTRRAPFYPIRAGCRQAYANDEIVNAAAVALDQGGTDAVAVVGEPVPALLGAALLLL